MNIPGHNLGQMRIRCLFDPGSEKEKFGSGINISGPQHWWKIVKMQEQMLLGRRYDELII